MRPLDWIISAHAVARFRNYKPQPVTFQGLQQWLNQWPYEIRSDIVSLLPHVLYLSEKQVEHMLVRKNIAITNKLRHQGLAPSQIIYVAFHDAGSSSGTMLNKLKECGRIERMRYQFVDAKDIERLKDLDKHVQTGAIIYVDDFIGSGNQYCDARDAVRALVKGAFAEYLLAPVICQEALAKLDERSIEDFSAITHLKKDRPLHDSATIFSEEKKRRLREISLSMHRKQGLGFNNMCAMVVLYRNAPNNVPLILRGSIGQTPYVGLFPRTTDFFEPIA